MDGDEPQETAICNECGGIRPSFGGKISPMLLKYAQWDIEDNGSFLKLNGALYTKPIATRIRRTGTSLMITFPITVMRYLDLEEGDAVKVIIIPDPERDKRRK